MDPNLLNKVLLSVVDSPFIAFGRLSEIKRTLNPTHNAEDKEKALLLVVRVCLKFSNEILEKSDINSVLKGFAGFISDLLAKNRDLNGFLLVFSCFYTLLSLFLRENWLGPSFFRDNADKRLHRDQKLKLNTPPKPMFMDSLAETAKMLQIPIDFDPNQFTLRWLKSQSIAFPKSEALSEFLAAGGEFFPKVAYPQIFVLLLELSKIMTQEFPNESYGRHLWRSRILFLYNRLLNNTPLLTLKTEITTGYDKVIKSLKEENNPNEKETLVRVLTEYSYVQSFYYKYNGSELTLREAMDTLGIELGFTGREGYRTKYQKFTVPILILQKKSKISNSSSSLGTETKAKEGLTKEETKSNEENKSKEETNSKEETKANEDSKANEEKSTEKPFDNIEEQIKSEECSDIPKAKDFLPSNVPLEEDSILFELPKLVPSAEPQQEIPLETLSPIEQLLVLAYLSHLLKSRAFDEVLKEQLSAGMDLLLLKSHNWLSYSQGLLMRSINEFPSYKRRERSLVQMGVLTEQFNDNKPELHERMRFFWELNYPFYRDLQKRSAELYMQNGSVLTSCEIFKKVDMLEECVECLAVSGLVKEAKELALELLSQPGRKTPKLLSILGELFQDAKYFKESWKLSKKKFPRPQKALARHYFFTAKQPQKAIKCFGKALAINPYDPGSLFTMGCIQMSLNDCEAAVKAFSAVVQIQEQNPEAWGNLASCFTRTGRKKEAFSCIQQAVKHNENSWKLWSNYMVFALELRKFSSFLESVRRLIELDQKQIIDGEVLAKTRQVFSYFVEKLRVGQSDVRKVEFYREVVEKTLNYGCEKLGEKWEVWSQLAEFFKDQEELYKWKQEQKAKLQKQQEDTPDERPSKIRFAEPEKTKDTRKTSGFLEKSFEARLKSCQCLMIVGWEQQTPLCQTLKDQLSLLVSDFKAMPPESQDREKIQYMLETVNAKLMKSLEINREALPWLD